MSTRKGQNGLVYQSGLAVKERGAIPARMPLGGVYRAVVIKTYPTDDAEHNAQGYHVLCDVILCKSLVRLVGVPVELHMGVADATVPWVPRETTKTLSGAELRLGVLDDAGRYLGEATPLDDLDGDLVRVQFTEGSPERPIVVGPSTHRATRRRVVAGAGWADATQDAQRGRQEAGEAYLRHGGTEVRINRAGDVLVDTVGASPTDDSAEVPGPAGGEVRVRLKRGRRLVVAGGDFATGAELLSVQQGVDGSVRAEMPGGLLYQKPAVGPATVGLLGASKAAVLGEELQAAGAALVTALTGYANALGPPGPPVALTTANAAGAAQGLTLALADFTAKLAAAQSAVVKLE